MTFKDKECHYFSKQQSYVRKSFWKFHDGRHEGNWLGKGHLGPFGGGCLSLGADGRGGRHWKLVLEHLLEVLLFLLI